MGSPSSTEQPVIVSIVMITYNHEQTIKESIEGILIQNCNFNYEIIVAEDCSPDNTEEVVNQIKKDLDKDNRIVYTRHDKNIGLMANFLYALNKSRGKFIAFCEGDDYWTDPNKLQKQVDFLQVNPEVSLCFTNAMVYYEDEDKKEEILNNSGEIPEKFSFDHYMNNYHAIPSCTMVFKNIFKEDPSYTHFQHSLQGDFTLRFFLGKHGDFGFINDTTAVYRKNSRGASSSRKFLKSNIYTRKLLSDYYNKKYDFFLGTYPFDIYEKLAFDDFLNKKPVSGTYYFIKGSFREKGKMRPMKKIIGNGKHCLKLLFKKKK